MCRKLTHRCLFTRVKFFPLVHRLRSVRDIIFGVFLLSQLYLQTFLSTPVSPAAGGGVKGQLCQFSCGANFSYTTWGLKRYFRRFTQSIFSLKGQGLFVHSRYIQYIQVNIQLWAGLVYGWNNRLKQMSVRLILQTLFRNFLWCGWSWEHKFCQRLFSCSSTKQTTNTVLR